MEIINLDMTPSTVTPNVHAGQYDSARTVRFMLKNGGTPYTLSGTETITAEITRSDNTEVTVNVTNTSSNYVDVVFDDTVCTVKGLYACELRLKDSDGFDIGSKNFALLVQRDPYDGAGVRIVTVGPADICTFETTLPEPLQSVIVNVVATGGYDADTQTAHPIAGYSSANITRCGVNLWDEEWEEGTIDGSTGSNVPYALTLRTKNYITINPTLTYYYVSSWYCNARWYDKDKNYLGYSVMAKNYNITIPYNNACYLRFVLPIEYGTTYNHDVAILYPSTNTSYVAWNGNTYTIAFGQTVYGGVLNVTRGKLTVTWGSVDLGSLSYEYDTTTLSIPIFYANISDRKQGDLYGLSDIYTCLIGARTLLESNNYAITRWNNSSGAIVIRNDDYTDKNAFKTAMSGHTLVYELDTPFDIDLTPKVISAVVGENNVSANCGETTVKYLKAGG